MDSLSNTTSSPIARILRAYPIVPLGRDVILFSFVLGLGATLWQNGVNLAALLRVGGMPEGQSIKLVNMVAGSTVSSLLIMALIMPFFIISMMAVYKAWKALMPLAAIEGPGKPEGTQDLLFPSQAVVLLFIPLVNLFWMFPAYLGLAKCGPLAAQMTNTRYNGPSRRLVMWYLVPTLLLTFLSIPESIMLSLSPELGKTATAAVLCGMLCLGLAGIAVSVVMLLLVLRMNAMTETLKRGWELYAAEGGDEPRRDL